jgi:hypothetical protein
MAGHWDVENIMEIYWEYYPQIVSVDYTRLYDIPQIYHGNLLGIYCI